MGATALRAQTSAAGRGVTGQGHVTQPHELERVLKGLVCVCPAKNCDPAFMADLVKGRMLQQDVAGHMTQDLFDDVALRGAQAAPDRSPKSAVKRFLTKTMG